MEMEMDRRLMMIIPPDAKRSYQRLSTNDLPIVLDSTFMDYWILQATIPYIGNALIMYMGDRDLCAHKPINHMASVLLARLHDVCSVRDPATTTIRGPVVLSFTCGNVVEVETWELLQSIMTSKNARTLPPKVDEYISQLETRDPSLMSPAMHARFCELLPKREHYGIDPQK